MRVKRLNYDLIAPTYDRRFAGGATSGIAVALRDLVRELGTRRVLEVGCGTGRWLSDLRPLTADLHGLDLSAGMLAQARRRHPSLRLTQGTAARLPYPSASFDLVYCVNAIHHFDRQREFVFDARRLLCPCGCGAGEGKRGGALAVVGTDPRGRRDQWYVYDFFPGTYETDLARFPARDAVSGWMAEAGLLTSGWRIVEYIRDDKIGAAVLDDPFLQKNATSQLALLSDDAYAAGLARIRAALAQADADGETLVFRTEIVIQMLVGWTEGE